MFFEKKNENSVRKSALLNWYWFVRFKIWNFWGNTTLNVALQEACVTLLKKLNLKQLISHFVHSDNDIVEAKDYFRWDANNGISQNLCFYKYLFTHIYILPPIPSLPSSSICMPENIFLLPHHAFLQVGKCLLTLAGWPAYRNSYTFILLSFAKKNFFFCLPNHNKVVLYCKMTSWGVNTQNRIE